MKAMIENLRKAGSEHVLIEDMEMGDTGAWGVVISISSTS